MKNYYEILGVSPGSADEDIKAAYRALARKCHPDLGGDPSRFDEINEAYRFLSDKVRRMALDASLHVRSVPRTVVHKEEPGRESPPAPPREEHAQTERRVPPAASGYTELLERQITEYEKLLLALSRCRVEPETPELMPTSIALAVGRNRSERDRARRR